MWRTILLIASLLFGAEICGLKLPETCDLKLPARDCRVLNGEQILLGAEIRATVTNTWEDCECLCKSTSECLGWVHDNKSPEEISESSNTPGSTTCVLYSEIERTSPDADPDLVSGRCWWDADASEPGGPGIGDMDTDLQAVAQELTRIRSTLRMLVSNAVNAQENAEMAERSRGGSGISFSRSSFYGKSYKPYTKRGVVGGLGIMNIHDHADHDRSLGIGEFSAVLNGVRFGTRHNDYVLWEADPDNPHCTRCGNLMELPPVPPEVLEKESVEDQIVEMREWFKAWQEQDFSVRDYRKYFWPVVVVLEGWWQEVPEDDSLEDPFISDRHQFEASTFEQMRGINRYLFASGGKWISENMGWLPSAFLDPGEGQIDPVRGQWMYRISARRVPFDVPLSTLRAASDFASRAGGPNNRPLKAHEYLTSRSVRFEVAPDWPVRDTSKLRKHLGKRIAQDPWGDYTSTKLWEVLDEIMYEVPGLDGIKGNLTERMLFNGNAKTIPRNGEVMNAARYTRTYSGPRDATGRAAYSRGVHDFNMFSAQTTNPKVLKRKGFRQSGTVNGEPQYDVLEGRWTYAIPTELVWLTPLNSWNPRDIEIYDKYDRRAPSPRAGGRSGKWISGDMEANRHNAFNGSAYWCHNLTPVEFFANTNVGETDAADTSVGSRGHLSRDGEAYPMFASGVHIQLPKIPGVESFQGTDLVRLRYPIAPVHEFQGILGQEILAQSEMTAGDFSQRYVGKEYRVDREAQGVRGPDDKESVHGTTAYLTGDHEHSITLTPGMVRSLLRGETVPGLVSSRFQIDMRPHVHVVSLRADSDGCVEISKIRANKPPDHDHELKRLCLD